MKNMNTIGADIAEQGIQVILPEDHGNLVIFSLIILGNQELCVLFIIFRGI